MKDKSETIGTATHTTANSPEVDKRPPAWIVAAAPAADVSLFALRQECRRKIVGKVENLRTKFKLLLLDFGLPDYIDARDIVPAMQNLVKRMTKNGGAALVYVRHSDGRPVRISGYVLSDEPIGPERRRFAKTTGARLTALRVYCPKVGDNLSLRLSMLTMPALSTNPEHPPMTASAGVLFPLYQDIATKLSDLTATTTAPSSSMASKNLGRSGHSGDTTEPRIANGRKCIDCGQPIGERGNRALYCERHGSKGARRQFRKNEAQALGLTQSHGRALALVKRAARNDTARPAARRNNDGVPPAVLEVKRRRRCSRPGRSDKR